MGDFGIAGLWLVLALVLVRGDPHRGLAAYGWRTAHSGSRSVRAQRGVVAVLDLCRTGLRRSARIHHRRRVGAVLLRGGQRLERGVHADDDVPADRRHARARADSDAAICSANMPRRSRARNGKNAIRVGGGTESARDALNEMYRVLGTEQASVASNPTSPKLLDRLGTLASERNQRILDAKPRIPGLLWTGLLFGGVVLVRLGGFMRLGSIRAHLLLLECGRRPARLAAVRRLLARPSVREPVGSHPRAVPAIPECFRLRRSRHMISAWASVPRPVGRDPIPRQNWDSTLTPGTSVMTFELGLPTQ